MPELTKDELLEAVGARIAEVAEKNRGEGRSTNTSGLRAKLMVEFAAHPEQARDVLARARGEAKPSRRGQADEPLMPRPFLGLDGPQNQSPLTPEVQALADEQAIAGRLGDERAADLDSRSVLDSGFWAKARGGKAAELVERFRARFGGQAVEDTENEVAVGMAEKMPIFRTLGDRAWKNSCVIDELRRGFLEACAKKLREAAAAPRENAA